MGSRFPWYISTAMPEPIATLTVDDLDRLDIAYLERVADSLTIVFRDGRRDEWWQSSPALLRQSGVRLRFAEWVFVPCAPGVH